MCVMHRLRKLLVWESMFKGVGAMNSVPKRVYRDKKYLFAAKFLSLSADEKAESLSSKPVPAPLGSASFGWIE